MKKIKKLTMFLAALMACGTMSVASGCMDLVMTGLLPQSNSETTDGGDSSVEETSDEEGASDEESSVEEAVTLYTVTFKDANGTVLQSTEVEEGETPVYAGATPTKAATAQYSYTFNGWDKELSAVTEDTVYTATYTETVNTYTVTFKNADGSILQSTELAYGETPNYATTPEKAGDVQYNYTFNGWDKSLSAVTGDVTYIATYTQVKKTYTVTFKNDDGTVLQSTEVAYGETPEYTQAAPTKEATAEFTYTFTGFGNLAAVVGNATYTATYEKTVNKYTVTFKNEDGTVLQSAKVEYGSLPVFVGVIPTKDSTAEYSYTFKGWDKATVAVTENVEFTATYNQTKNKYVVTFKNADGSVLQSSEVEYGVTPAYEGTPTKAADMQYVYTFAGWTPEVKAVDGTATYIATYEAKANTYKVTIKYNNGTEDEVIEGATYGMTANELYANVPEKEGHTFEGWYIGDNKLATSALITGESVVEARYTVNTYTVKFLSWDGTVLQSTEVAWGTTPEYKGETPQRPNTADTEYAFIGWDRALEVVSGEATYTAQFSEGYSVQWIVDSAVYTTTKVAKGEAATAPTKAPEKEGNVQYSYTFSHWSVTENGEETSFDAINASGMKYYAVFKAVLNKYTVTFVNEDGTELDSQEVEYGATPEYAGETPTKASTESTVYTFKGWDKAIGEVNGDITYTATYSEEARKYTITFANNLDNTVETLEVAYGKTPEFTASATKTTTEAHSTTTHKFAAWDKAFETVTGEATYTAKYEATVSTWDGTMPTLADGATEATLFEGEGTAEKPYLIQTATDLAELSVISRVTTKNGVYSNTSVYFVLAVDMDMLAENWTPIAYYGHAAGWGWGCFGANLDGQNHTVSFKRTGVDYALGLFEGVKGGTIQNIKFEGTLSAKNRAGAVAYYCLGATLKNITSAVNITTTDTAGLWVGGIVGTVTGATTFENCHNTGTITTVGQRVGGITGNIEGTFTATMTNCTNSGALSAKDYVGGMVGYVSAGVDITIDGCTNGEDGIITASATIAGGIVGYVAGTTDTVGTTTIINSTNEGNVTATGKSAGGIIGGRAYNADTSISDCTNTGDITASEQVGGIINYNYGNGTNHIGVVQNCTNEGTIKTTTGNKTATDEIGSADHYAGLIVGQCGDKPGTVSGNKFACTVTWKNADGTVLETDTGIMANSGVMAEYNGATPTKAADAQGTYTFAGWDKAVSEVTGSITYTAKFDTIYNKYTVTFVNYDDSELQSSEVEYGKAPVAPANPSRAGYIFLGWSETEDGDVLDTLPTVDGAVTYYAVFEKVDVVLTLTLDGETLDEIEVDDEGKATLPTTHTVTKENGNVVTYTITGWKNGDVAVDGDTQFVESATLTAVYTLVETRNGVIVTQDDNGDVYTFDNSKLSATYTATSVPMEMPERGVIEYTFKYRDLVDPATYASSCFQFLVFVNPADVAMGAADDSAHTYIRFTINLHNGGMYIGINTNYKSYTLAGKDISSFWTNSANDLAGAANEDVSLNIKIEYAKGVLNLYINGDQVFEYDASNTKANTHDGIFNLARVAALKDLIENPAGYGFGFGTTKDSLESKVQDISISNIQVSNYVVPAKMYTVQFVDADGTVIQTAEVEEGEMPSVPADPTKAATAQYTYTFAGWDKEISAVTGNVTYTATYTETVRKYTVEFVNYDGTVLQSSEVAYGEMPEYTGATPVKPSTVEANYSFKGWDKQVAEVEGAITYTATFEEAASEYTVTFLDENGEELQKTVMNYGETPVYNGTPAKDGYVFAGWATSQGGTVAELAKVTTDATYYAVFTYSIWDGTFPSVEGKTEADFFTGSGTESDPYILDSAAKFAAFSALSQKKSYGDGKYFKLTVNVDLSGGNWIPVCEPQSKVDGAWYNADKRTTMFNGVFDGGDYAVKMKEATASKACFTGLFFAIGNGTVKNLKVEGTIDNVFYSGVLSALVLGKATIDNVDSYVTLNAAGDDSNSIVGLIGMIQPGVTGVTIKNCDNYGAITAPKAKVGAIVGIVETNTGVTIENCTNNAAVTGEKYVGGLVGLVGSGAVAVIKTSTNDAAVTGTDRVGGFVGQISPTGQVTVENCTNAENGAIVAGGNGGGIVGYVESTGSATPYNIAKATVKGSTNNGSVTVSGYNAGGIIGARTWHGSTVVENCTNTGAISAVQGNVGGIIGYAHHNGSLGVNGQVLNCVNTGTVTRGGVSATTGYGVSAAPVGYIVGLPDGAWYDVAGNTYEINGEEYVTISWRNENGSNILNETKKVGDTITFTGTAPTKAGYVFAGWSVEKGGELVELGTVTECVVYYPVFVTVESTLFEGKGTAESPYLIQTAEDLWELSNLTAGKNYGNADLYFKVTADIDVSDKNWQPICSSKATGWVSTANSFNANFDGNGKTITFSGVYTGDTWAKGFFSGIGGYVHDLTLKGTLSSEKGVMGALAGQALDGAKIENVTNHVNVTSTGYGYLGGLVGGTIGSANVTYTNCVNYGAISGANNHIGGIVGQGYANVTYVNCVNHGTITGSGHTGGIAGEASLGTTFTNCSNDGKVSSAGVEATADFVSAGAGLLAGGANANTFKITITWIVEGETSTTTVAVNAVPAYDGTPAKDGYLFEGWALTEGGEVLESIPAATSYATYYAIFREVAGYTVSFANEDGTVIETVEVKEGETPAFTGTEPTKDGYVFKGWSATKGGAVLESIPTATGNTTYYAVFVTVESTLFAGSGTAEDPYQIATADDLMELSALAKDKNYGAGLYFKVTADIDVSDKDWTPICINTDDKNNWPNEAFMGTFDGGNHTITLNNNKAKHANGLFAKLGGTVKNLTMAGTVGGDTALTAQGALAGIAMGGAVIENVHNTATVTGSGANVGGLVGTVSQNGAGLVSFKDCTNTGTVTGGGNYIGGLVGGGYAATTFDNCHNSGNVTGGNTAVGAITGEFFAKAGSASGGVMKNCSNTIDGKSGVITANGTVTEKLAGNK